VNNCVCEFLGARLSSNVFGSYFSIFQHLIHRVPDHVSVNGKIDVPQQFGRAEEHGGGVGHVLADGFGVGVARSLRTRKCNEI
jgi:hypothetical protein